MRVYTNQPIYVYVVNLDERGEFKADVRDARTGETIFVLDDYDINEDFFHEREMKHKDDLDGLKKYLLDLKMIENDAALCRVGSETGPVEVDRMLLLGDHRGVYIPKDFAEGFNAEKWGLTSAEDKVNLEVLREGPENEYYWEAWDSILAEAKSTDPLTGYEYTLEQDGDLFAVAYAQLVEGVDAFIESPTW